MESLCSRKVFDQFPVFDRQQPYCIRFCFRQKENLKFILFLKFSKKFRQTLSIFENTSENRKLLELFSPPYQQNLFFRVCVLTPCFHGVAYSCKHHAFTLLNKSKFNSIADYQFQIIFYQSNSLFNSSSSAHQSSMSVGLLVLRATGKQLAARPGLHKQCFQHRFF